jgi:transcriptional regulator with XRE-family HTH domain
MSRENSGNPVKKLREALGMNQVEFAKAIGRSYASVQGYEAGKRVPREVVEKMKTLAVKRGWPELALELSSEEWQVRRLFHPGELIISQARQALSGAAEGSRIDLSEQQRKSARDPDVREAYHRMLDFILDSGHDVAIEAVMRNLHAFERLVGVDRAKHPRLSKQRSLPKKPG